jgi:hypothetical protein
MTGRISALKAGNASGRIKTETGDSVSFDSTAVLEYDIVCLAVGQAVSFDLEGVSQARAINVCVHKQSRAPDPSEARKEVVRVRYLGFEQVAGLRAYRFDRTAPGEKTILLTVTTDLALFAKHHVGIQEGPTLCLRLLTEALGSGGGALKGSLQLSDHDLLAHIARRPVPKPRPRPKRAPSTAAAPHAF